MVAVSRKGPQGVIHSPDVTLSSLALHINSGPEVLLEELLEKT